MSAHPRWIVSALAVALLGVTGCGDGTDATVVIRSPGGPQLTPGPVPTATPGAGPTATAAAPTATAGGPTATGVATPTVAATPGGGAAEAATIMGDTIPFLQFAIGLAGGSTTSASASAAGLHTGAEAQEVDDCPDGGTRTEEQVGLAIEVTLDACRFADPGLGNFQFDGTIDIDLSGTVTFDVTTQDLDSGRNVTFTGSVSGAPASGGGFVIDGGPVVVSTPQGDFTLTFDALTVDGDGNVVSGAGTAEDDDDNFELMRIDFTVRPGGGLADLVATFDDASTSEFVLNLETGELTPAS